MSFLKEIVRSKKVKVQKHGKYYCLEIKNLKFITMSLEAMISIASQEMEIEDKRIDFEIINELKKNDTKKKFICALPEEVKEEYYSNDEGDVVFVSKGLFIKKNNVKKIMKINKDIADFAIRVNQNLECYVYENHIAYKVMQHNILCVETKDNIEFSEFDIEIENGVEPILRIKKKIIEEQAFFYRKIRFVNDLKKRELRIIGIDCMFDKTLREKKVKKILTLPLFSDEQFNIDIDSKIIRNVRSEIMEVHETVTNYIINNLFVCKKERNLSFF